MVISRGETSTSMGSAGACPRVMPTMESTPIPASRSPKGGQEIADKNPERDLQYAAVHIAALSVEVQNGIKLEPSSAARCG
jgi:hypothetical protein